MLAIVLSGGGSKGAYEIGVWKALKRLKIKYDIVTGTSVGALNAALMTQNTYFRAVNLWRKIDFDKVVDEDIDKDKIIKSYTKNIIRGGMNTTHLEHTVEKALNLKKFYKSKINMGLITVKLDELEPISLTKNDIDPDKLKDYLVASASCFPAFKVKDIEDGLYIDGGYFDNLPINLAISMGATEVIAVDLKEVGLKRKVENDNIKITTISPRNNIGSFLVFDNDISKRAIRLGYNDTLKQFDKLDGDKFSFKKNHLIKNYDKYHIAFEKETEYEIDLNSFNAIVEKLGELFEIDDSYIYNIKKFNKLLIKKFNETKTDKTIIEQIKENKLKRLFSNKYMVKYIYTLVSNEEFKELQKVFKVEYECAVYLKVIMEAL